MSNTVSGIINSSKFTANLNGTSISISQATFICMYNDLEGNSWGGSSKKANAALNRRANAYINSKDKTKYFVWTFNKKTKQQLHELNGHVVYIVPNNDFDGTFDEYRINNFKVLGTILLDEKGKIYIETDLKTIEIMRREKEFAKMDNGYMSISYQEDGEFITIKTSDKYKEYLEKNDNEKGSMICRGHGL